MKSLAERWAEARFASQPHGLNWEDFQAMSRFLGDMFTELREELCDAPSRAKNTKPACEGCGGSGWLYGFDQASKCPRCHGTGDLPHISERMLQEAYPTMRPETATAKISEPEVTEEMGAAGRAVIADFSHAIATGCDYTRVARQVYRAMKVLEPKRPVGFTEGMVERALAAWHTSAKGPCGAYGHMRAALRAALATPPAEGEAR